MIANFFFPPLSLDPVHAAASQIILIMHSYTFSYKSQVRAIELKDPASSVDLDD